ncbi:MAG: DUF937 domain-containing protein [Flavobacteriaceae bacterium]|nr:DUF937 domain-containing protein [Flavobacteriaceae bacterium]
MSGILDLLKGGIGEQLVGSLSQGVGENPEKVSSALTTALPMLLGAMKNQTADEQGASGLLNALKDGKHDGSILENVSNLAGNSEVEKDGEGILGHLFGDKLGNVAQVVGMQSGMSSGSVMSMLKMAAPVVMGFLGKKTQESGVSDTNGIGDMLGGLLGGSGDQAQSMVTKLLDADGDGSVMDDVLGMVTKGKAGGIGDMVGGMFK